MNSKRIILLNGPINSGKDVLGEHLAKTLPRATTMIFKDSLYDWAAAMASLPKEVFVQLASDRKTKELPCHLLPKHPKDFTRHYSPREWLIYVSEEVIKPRLGKDFFGVQSRRKMFDNFENYDTVIFTDCGFAEEVLCLTSFYEEQALLLQIHRPGYEFGPTDSRSYVNVEKVKTIKLHNDSTLEAFFSKGSDIIHYWEEFGR